MDFSYVERKSRMHFYLLKIVEYILIFFYSSYLYKQSQRIIGWDQTLSHVGLNEKYTKYISQKKCFNLIYFSI
jgi:hypothetical protein